MTPIQTRKFTEKVSSMAPINKKKGDIVIINNTTCEFFKQDKYSDRILLHIHGGAFAFGSINTHRGLLNYLFNNSSFDIITPEYSLTPDAPFPIALNEILEVYHFLKKTFPKKKIFISGDSAGGNLAASLTLKLIENNLPIPNGIILLSPWLDLRDESIARKINNDKDSGFDADDLDEYADLYQSQPLRDNPFISPLVVTDLKDFPPTLIQVATNELLYTDSEIFAINLINSGVNVTFTQEDNLFHSWQLFPDYFTPAKKSLDEVIDMVSEKGH